MSDIALSITSTQEFTVETDRPVAPVALISAEIIALGMVLALLQVIDGVLTGIGVTHFGTSIEGNFLMRYLMEVIGPINTLIVVKGAALLIVMLLCRLAVQITWVKTAMRAVITLYILAAVLPWSYILLTANY